MRELKQPRRGTTSISMHEIAVLLDLPEDLEPVSLHVENDPDRVVLVFEGDRLAGHPGNRHVGYAAPYFTVTRETTTDETGTTTRMVWNGLPDLPPPASARASALEHIAMFGAPRTPSAFRQSLADLGYTQDEVHRLMKARFEPSASEQAAEQ